MGISAERWAVHAAKQAAQARVTGLRPAPGRAEVPCTEVVWGHWSSQAAVDWLSVDALAKKGRASSAKNKKKE